MSRLNRLVRTVVVGAVGVSMASCGRAAADPRMVSEWMHTLYGVVRVERLSPPVGSRLMAYASAALYSGMSAVNPRMKPLTGLKAFPTLPASDNASYDEIISAVAAERVVVDSMFSDGLPTSRATLSRLADSLLKDRDLHVTTDVAGRSRDIGTKVGLAIVAWAHGDGFDSTRGKKYVPPVGTGLWVNDSPSPTFSTTNISGVSSAIENNDPGNSKRQQVGDRALILSPPKRGGTTMPGVNMAGITEPYWGYLRPFVLVKWDECPAAASPMYGTTPGTPLYDQAMMVYDTRKALTPEQKTIALYWADNPGESGTPAGHWLSIGAQVVSERKLSGEDAARVMVATSISLADAFIASWGYKFKINLIRPRTYIRQVMDSTWEPAIPTPPFPEYLSGHSTVSSAAATALTALLGAAPFDDSTSVFVGHSVRRFDSFRAAADKAGLSRIYGGIHYPIANTAGQDLGRCVGGKVIERLGAAVRP